MSYRKSVFFVWLKRWMACLWPSGGRRRILRLSLLKKQDVSSTLSRAKTVLISEICVEKISVSSVAIKKLSLWLHIQPKISNYAKQTQFLKYQKCFNISRYKELQQIMRCGLLCKTNPIKPNFSNGRIGAPQYEILHRTPYGGATRHEIRPDDFG